MDARLRATPAMRIVDARLRPLTDAAVRVADRITTSGRAVLLVGVLAWFGGWRLGWRELMIVAAACLLVDIAALAFTLGRESLEVALSLEPTRVTVGEPALGRVSVRNAGARQVLATRLEVSVGAGGLARIDPPSLGRDEEFSDVFVIPTQRRAVINVGPVRSVRGDPLALAQRELRWSDSIELFVHPYVELLPAVAAGWMRDLEGTPTNDLSPSDVAFHTLREYVPGDDRRNIHWRTSARTGTLMVRQFVDTRRAHLGIVLSSREDDYASDEEFELAVSVAGSLGASALAHEQQVTCTFDGRVLPTFARHKLLDALSGVEASSKGDNVVTAVRRVRHHLDAASVGVLITGSRVAIDHLRAASTWFPAHLGVVVVRMDPTGEAGLRLVGANRVVTVTKVSDLTLRLATMARR